MNDWISADPEILGGKPCVRGTRVSVEFILELMASGASPEAISESYPQVPVAAVQAALAYAARAMRNDVVWEIKLSA
jgi:uncharacterized protein (DUF433 family)